jgi:hypothetical protein
MGLEQARSDSSFRLPFSGQRLEQALRCGFPGPTFRFSLSFLFFPLSTWFYIASTFHFSRTTLSVFESATAWALGHRDWFAGSGVWVTWKGCTATVWEFSLGDGLEEKFLDFRIGYGLSAWALGLVRWFWYLGDLEGLHCDSVRDDFCSIVMPFAAGVAEETGG